MVAPGLTIRDSLRVLQPNDTESYFKRMELVPPDPVGELGKARIVITNYHAFRKRELLELAKGTRQFMEGWRGEQMATTETEGQMLQRVMSELMGMKQVLIINDEAHHCYREKPFSDEERDKIQLSSEEKAEAKSHRQAARMWVSGIEPVSRKIGKGQQRVIDLSATPFFLAPTTSARRCLRKASRPISPRERPVSAQAASSSRSRSASKRMVREWGFSKDFSRCLTTGSFLL